MTRSHRLLTIGHSYSVALNRRLAESISRAGNGRWDVTVVAPSYVAGDLRPISFEQDKEPSSCQTCTVPTYFTSRPHIMLYGRELRNLLCGSWDIVHAWQEPYVFSGWQISRWVKRTRFVFYSFQNIAKRYVVPFNWIERDTVARSAGWIAAGQTIVETLLPRPGYRQRPHCAIGLGVDTACFRTDPAARMEVCSTLGWDHGGPPVVGYLGRFIPAKGIRLLLRALSNVSSPWRALFVGGGPMEQELRMFQSRYPDRVRIVTTATHSQVPAYLNAMDIMCAPSQTTARWREQFGRMLIEAFATGLCVIASDSGEIPHVVGDAAQILPEANEAAWSAALGELIDSPIRRREFAQRGIERVHSHFSWPVIGHAHVAFFEQLLDHGV